jgi:hypothetical protein
MVADQRADNRQRVVLKEDLGRLHYPVLLEEADDFQNIRPDRASLHPAAGILTLQASVCFIDYMYRHFGSPYRLNDQPCANIFLFSIASHPRAGNTLKPFIYGFFRLFDEPAVILTEILLHR